MRLHCLCALAAMVLFVAVAPISGLAATLTNPQQHADELFAADRSFAEAGANTDAVGSLSPLFASDVIMPVRGKGFAKGKADVIEALKANPDTSGARGVWTPVGVGVSADGMQGFTCGFMTENQLGGKQARLKYLAYWRRDESGWRVIAYKRGGRAQGPIASAPRSALLPGPMVSTAKAAAGSINHTQTLAQAEQAFSNAAQRAGLAAAFAEFGTADSMNLGGAGNTGFVFGAEAISALVGAGEPEHGSSVSWAADERVVVAESGDLGLSVGYIRFNQRAEDGSKRSPIAFFTVWRRASADQPWRYVAE